MEKYLKYKKKYLTLKDQIGGWFPDYKSILLHNDTDNLRINSRKEAHNLLKTMSEINVNGKNLQIATSESLTAGLIFTTLVDVPFGGYLKYGCFGVYDTNAKREMLDVKVENVYSSKCVLEMAVGTLNNSNATLAVAVSGNAMATKGDEKKMGEVFIGVAGYSSDNEIIVQTSVYNFCQEYPGCNLWFDVTQQEKVLNNNLTEEQKDLIKKELSEIYGREVNIGRLLDGFNDFQLTSVISHAIRYKTVIASLKLATQFIKENALHIPKWNRHVYPDTTFNRDEFKMEIICKNLNCEDEGLEGSSFRKFYDTKL